MHYVYILKSEKNAKLYRGSADDLKQRLVDHNSGKVKSTRVYRPWRLIYYEAFISKQDARREEIFLKSGKGRERIKWLFAK
ncbi:MAG: GIY-YIG nuclease family protein [Candidatus Ryanbacteria bacterium]|nr:GIY-YIG nuclease family protein [Candidatus Ryanbacteria bacterium]